MGGAGLWQNALQSFPQTLGRSFNAAQIGALSRLLSQTSASPSLINPKAASAANWRRISAAVKGLARKTVSRSRAAVAARSLRGSDGESLSRNLADLASLGQAVSGVRLRSIGRLRKSIDALVKKQAAAERAAVARQSRPNFDGGGALPALDFSADAGEIAQLRAGPPQSALDAQARGFAAYRSGAAVRESFRGPVEAVPNDIIEPLAPEAVQSYSGPKPLPAPRVVQSAMETVSDSLSHFITHSYPGVPGADPIQAVADFVNRYTKDASIPNSQKYLILKYYEINDPRLFAAIQAAVKARIKITIITDLNEYLIGKFGPKVNSTWDFEHASYKKSNGGIFLRKLRALGFAYKTGSGRLAILSGVPLFNPKNDRENPIMHDKVAVALGIGVPVAESVAAKVEAAVGSEVAVALGVGVVSCRKTGPRML